MHTSVFRRNLHYKRVERKTHARDDEELDDGSPVLDTALKRESIIEQVIAHRANNKAGRRCPYGIHIHTMYQGDEDEVMDCGGNSAHGCKAQELAGNTMKLGHAMRLWLAFEQTLV